SNDVTRLQALVDKKKVVITEAAIRDVLRLDDAEGVDCLPNKEIFAELACMGRKFNFYKYIIDSLVRNVDNTSKFYMYPRFIQLLIRRQLGDLSTHTTKYTSPTLTQKVFANMRRVGKEFSEVETPLFKGMIVEQVIEEGGADEEHVGDDIAAQGDDTTPQPQPQPQAQQQATDFPMSLLQEALNTCVALTRRVEHLEYDKVALALEITKLKGWVKKLEKGNRVKVLKLRRLKKVGTSQRIDTSEDTVMDDTSNRERMIDDLDKDDVVALMDDKEEEKKEEKAKIADDDQIQGRQAKIYKIDTDSCFKSSKLDYFNGMSYDDIRPIFKAKFNTNVDFLLKTKEQMEEEESRALQTINETPAQKAAKRRKLSEEVEDLKRHLEIVPDEDDNVYTEATPLARKVLVVDYKIIHLNNKPHYKIIRADGTHQLYVSFLTLLKNFDREDLESLWSLVKERFSTSKPNNFSDDFLLTTLGAMFEKPNGQAQV
nr:hypothetical protein [Tanacetum cinerariifolium]